MIEAIKKEIRDRLNLITDDVINGSCMTFDQYRYQCGIAYGMVIAEEIIKEAEKKARRSVMDDED